MFVQLQRESENCCSFVAVFELPFSENRREEYLKHEARFIADFTNSSQHAVQFYYRVYCDTRNLHKLIRFDFMSKLENLQEK